MGKKSKRKITTTEELPKKNRKREIEEINNETNCIPKIKNNKKHEKDKCEKSTNNIDTNADVAPIITNKTKKTRKCSISNETTQQEVGINDDETVSINKNKQGEKKSKKILFVDDSPVEVAADSSRSLTSIQTNKKKNKSKQLQEEEEINDEDIDKFCDELTEEDNVQFDNWVKLIEAKMHAKK